MRKLDYLIVDLPPGTSDIHITLSQNFNITGTIIISTPQKVSTIDAEKAISMFQHKNTNIPIIGLIENMSYFQTEQKKHYLVMVVEKKLQKNIQLNFWVKYQLITKYLRVATMDIL